MATWKLSGLEQREQWKEAVTGSDVNISQEVKSHHPGVNRGEKNQMNIENKTNTDNDGREHQQDTETLKILID